MSYLSASDYRDYFYYSAQCLLPE